MAGDKPERLTDGNLRADKKSFFQTISVED
jgi:hypothetical protein